MDVGLSHIGSKFVCDLEKNSENHTIQHPRINPVYLRDCRSEFSKLRSVHIPQNCFTLTYNADPDDMPHLAAFHLCLHCLPMYSFRSLQYTRG